MTHQPYFNGTTLQDLFQYSNLVTDSYWGPFITFGTFFVVLVTLKNFYDWNRSLLTASYISFVLGSILVVAGVISQEMWFLLGLILLISIAAIFWME